MPDTAQHAEPSHMEHASWVVAWQLLALESGFADVLAVDLAGLEEPII